MKERDEISRKFAQRPGESDFDYNYRTMRMADASQDLKEGCLGCAVIVFGVVGYSTYELIKRLRAIHIRK